MTVISSIPLLHYPNWMFLHIFPVIGVLALQFWSIYHPVKGHGELLCWTQIIYNCSRNYIGYACVWMFINLLVCRSSAARCKQSFIGHYVWERSIWRAGFNDIITIRMWLNFMIITTVLFQNRCAFNKRPIAVRCLLLFIIPQIFQRIIFGRNLWIVKNHWKHLINL